MTGTDSLVPTAHVPHALRILASYGETYGMMSAQEKSGSRQPHIEGGIA
jgi:hypothetical protein